MNTDFKVALQEYRRQLNSDKVNPAEKRYKLEMFRKEYYAKKNGTYVEPVPEPVPEPEPVAEPEPIPEPVPEPEPVAEPEPVPVPEPVPEPVEDEDEIPY
jgi:outer membrane biosynthesis protein TonB